MLAAAMARDPERFVTDLMAQNLAWRAAALRSQSGSQRD